MGTKSGTKVEAEEPKTTVDAPASTTKEDKPKEDKPKAVAPTVRQYRLLDGVDASKFRGQRETIVKGMQKLATERGPDDSFTVADIVAYSEGLVSKTPLEASVKFHLNGLLKDKAVQLIEVPALSTIG